MRRPAPVSRRPGELSDRLCGDVRSAELGAMANGVERNQLTAVDSLLDIGTNLARRQRIVCTLNHQSGNRYSGKIIAIVGQERRACENPGACRVGATETLSELV